MLYADIETTDIVDAADGRREWIRIEHDRGYVSLSRDYLSSHHDRRQDPEAGIGFHLQHIDTVIEALRVIRAEILGSGQPESAE